ncbi:hypothetical protein H9P43_006556 [Blastocladiella emersonii ATCC 22665]|nr:hypothetical protein H9P43_006556 [Blastocladiella emersonii ATCC 22665]
MSGRPTATRTKRSSSRSSEIPASPLVHTIPSDTDDGSPASIDEPQEQRRRRSSSASASAALAALAALATTSALPSPSAAADSSSQDFRSGPPSPQSPASPLSSVDTPPRSRSSSPSPPWGSDSDASGSESDEDDDAHQPGRKPKIHRCETLEQLNLCTLVRIALWQHLKKHAAPAEIPRRDALALLADAVMKLFAKQEVLVRLYTVRVDHPGVLRLAWFNPVNYIEPELGFGLEAGGAFKRALEKRILEYIGLCAGLRPPGAFQIPAECTVRAAPDTMNAVLLFDGNNVDVARIAADMTDGSDEEALNELIKFRTPRAMAAKRPRGAPNPVDEEPFVAGRAAKRQRRNAPADSVPRGRRPSAAVAAAAAASAAAAPVEEPPLPAFEPVAPRRRFTAPTPVYSFEQDFDSEVLAAPPKPRRKSRHTARRTTGTVAPQRRIVSASRDPSPSPPPTPPRLAPNEPAAAPPAPTLPQQQHPNQVASGKVIEVVDLTMSSDDEREDVKPKIEDLYSPLEYSADVFDALGNHTTRLSAGEFEKRVQIGYRRGWSVARTAEWVRGV